MADRVEVETKAAGAHPPAASPMSVVPRAASKLGRPQAKGVGATGTAPSAAAPAKAGLIKTADVEKSPVAEDAIKVLTA